MGLDTTHNAYHGGYGTFTEWRTKVAHLAGFPPLRLMEGYYVDSGGSSFMPPTFTSQDILNNYSLKSIIKSLPIKWDLFMSHKLTSLLLHSDCEGYLTYGQCKRIAEGLEEILPLFKSPEDDYFKQRTVQFIEGARLAYSLKEKLEFH